MAAGAGETPQQLRRVGFSRRTRFKITSVRLRAVSTVPGSGKSSGVSGRSSVPPGPVIDDAVGPTVPQRLDDGHELLGPGIAIRMAQLPGAAKVARSRGKPRSNNVPGHAAVADVVKRRELPCQIKRQRAAVRDDAP
jgi:hypothetical protein